MTEGLGKQLTELSDSIARDISRYRALTPPKRALFRATFGMALMVFCAFLAFATFAGMEPNIAIKAYFAAWSAGGSPMIMVAIWTGALALGIAWFFVGIQGPRGPRDTMQIFWSVAFFLVFLALAEWNKGHSLLEFVFAAGTIGSATRLVLSLLPPSKGEAAGVVEQQIQRQTVNWQVGKRRQF